MAVFISYDTLTSSSARTPRSWTHLEPKITGPSADRNQFYGWYEVRFRTGATDGYKLAWLLWPKSSVWPREGEIDFPEGDLVGSIGASVSTERHRWK